MGHARLAGVALLVRQVRVHPVQEELKALGRIAQAAQGEATS